MNDAGADIYKLMHALDVYFILAWSTAKLYKWNESILSSVIMLIVFLFFCGGVQSNSLLLYSFSVDD